MKKIYLQTALWLVKLLALLSYFGLLWSQLIYMWIILGVLLGIILLLWIRTSKRDTRYIRITTFYVILGVITWYVLLPLIAYVFFSSPFQDIVGILFVSGLAATCAIAIGIALHYSEIDVRQRQMWGNLTRKKYARIVFCNIMLFTAIIFMVYSTYYHESMLEISLASLLFVFP